MAKEIKTKLMYNWEGACSTAKEKHSSIPTSLLQVTHTLWDETSQHTKSQKNTLWVLTESIPNNTHDNTQIGIAFVARVHQLSHCQRGVPIERSVPCESQRLRPNSNMPLHCKMTSTGKDRFCHNSADIEQREVKSVNRQVLRADIKQWNMI